MPGAFKICDNHAVKCQTVPTDMPTMGHRGRTVRLCRGCIQKLREGKRLWLDDRYDVEDELGPMKAAESIKFKRRQSDFDKWIGDNADVWNSFCEVADEMRIKVDHCSHWLCANVVRYEKIKRQKTGDFKIPNDAIAFMARKYMSDQNRRGRRGFFKIKRLEGEDWKSTKARCGIGRENT